MAGAFKLADQSRLGIGLHCLFRTISVEISKDTLEIGEQGLEVAPFLPEPKNSAEVTRLQNDVKKPWLRANLKEVKNPIDNQTSSIEDPEPDEQVTPCIDVYKEKIQSNGTIDKFKLGL